MLFDQVRNNNANRLRGIIAVILDWCDNALSRQGRQSRGVESNNLQHANLPKPSNIATVKHHALPSWRDIREHMTALQRDNSIVAMALQLIVLTAARTNEIRLAPWSEIGIKHRIWRIPASRMKADRPHTAFDGRMSGTERLEWCEGSQGGRGHTTKRHCRRGSDTHPAWRYT
jgi:integrase